jgi:hypothetical protein
MSKRWGVAHAFVGFAGTGAVLSACLAWTACHSASVPLPASTGDAASDTGEEPIVEQPEGEACNPCFQVCPCTPGLTFYDPGTCTTYTCLNGTWGGTGCGGLGCHDASRDGEGGDATLPQDAGDAAVVETGDSSVPLDAAEASLPDAAPMDATGD